MKLDDQLIDQIRNSCSITQVVGGYVRLKKSGKDYSALCPFHSEKTPSFLVSESKQIFKCFGCGVGGDVFKFLMLMENLSFPDAVQYLAEKTGVAVQPSRKQAGETNQRQQLLRVMEAAAEFFEQALAQGGQNDALAYLKQRQIETSTIRKFRLGYAPPGNRLLESLKSQGFSKDQLMACGLAKEGENGQLYDKFRHRIIFPIRDLNGRIIAFGGRALGDALPKYLNSPETILYSKGNHLFGLDVTFESIRRSDFAVLVEGYFDCIVPFQHGVTNIVASLGTGLTQNQVKLLGRYTRNVVVNYDPDSAGMTAALRSIDLFLEHGFRVNVLQLPRGQDPDTFIREAGLNAYQEYLKSSVPYIDFVLSRFTQEQANPSSPRGKQEIVTGILPYLTKIPNRIERVEYVSRIASQLKLDPQVLLMELRKMPRPREDLRVVSAPRDMVTPAEAALLGAVFDEELCSETLALLDLELLEGLRTQAIFGKILELKQQNKKINVINVRDLLAGGEDRELLENATLLCCFHPLSTEMVRSSISALRRKQYERVSRQIQEEIKEAERHGSFSGRLSELLMKKEEIRRKIGLDSL